MKKELENINGILILDKPVGISSNRALQIVKRLFKAKKAGHTGSLDVLASGLLPICFGEATKFSQYLLDADKRYYVAAKLGERTTTCDAEGAIIVTQSTEFITEELLQSVLAKFRGTTEQIPSMYSALKHQGQPLYKLARRGIEVERQPRKITIYELKLLRWAQDTLELEVHCSKGTYIRNLVDDIGMVLGCGAYVTALRRLEVGIYRAEQMITIEQLQNINDAAELKKLLLPIDSCLSHLPSLQFSVEEAKAISHGKIIQFSTTIVGLARALDHNSRFLGIVKVGDDRSIRVERLIAATCNS